MKLIDICSTLAHGIKLADVQRPQAVGSRTGLAYQAGIGPHTESATTKLALDALGPEVTFDYALEVPHMSTPRARCDLVITAPDQWAVEIKMLRLVGDNGRPNDNMITHILSPYPVHRSALTDFTKLLDSGLPGNKAIIVFGYDYDGLPMDPAIEALDVLASQRVALVDRANATFSGLVHPVHQRGRVFGWQVEAQR